MARVVSVNLGTARSWDWNGHPVRSAIGKAPVRGRVKVLRLGLDGDEQADHRVHGGPRKAVYAYPIEHYPFWHAQLPAEELPPGSFGENLTVEGIRESGLHLGDRLQIGSATFEVTQPRLPCTKLNARFRREDMIVRFARSLRTGFYLAVTEEGELGAGDEIELLAGGPGTPTVEESAIERLGPAGEAES
jgi:MOSC domain-containing protein YiiM